MKKLTLSLLALTLVVSATELANAQSLKDKQKPIQEIARELTTNDENLPTLTEKQDAYAKIVLLLTKGTEKQPIIPTKLPTDLISLNEISKQISDSKSDLSLTLKVNDDNRKTFVNSFDGEISDYFIF